MYAGAHWTCTTKKKRQTVSYKSHAMPQIQREVSFVIFLVLFDSLFSVKHFDTVAPFMLNMFKRAIKVKLVNNTHCLAPWKAQPDMVSRMVVYSGYHANILCGNAIHSHFPRLPVTGWSLQNEIRSTSGHSSHFSKFMPFIYDVAASKQVMCFIDSSKNTKKGK